MNDNRLALMCGIDIPVLELKASIHQPTLKEIAFLGETNFFKSLQILLINKDFFSQDKTFLESTTNFQIFMMIISEKKTKEVKQDIIALLQILFPIYKISFTPSSIIFIKDNTSFFLDDNNFEVFQHYLKLIFCIKDNAEEKFNPANNKAKEIAEKILKGRKKVAAEKEKNNSSIFSQYISVIVVGIKSMSFKEATDLTVYQLYDLIERYQLYIGWDIDIKSRLAGAKADSPVENWMKNIH